MAHLVGCAVLLGENLSRVNIVVHGWTSPLLREFKLHSRSEATTFRLKHFSTLPLSVSTAFYTHLWGFSPQNLVGLLWESLNHLSTQPERPMVFIWCTFIKVKKVGSYQNLRIISSIMVRSGEEVSNSDTWMCDKRVHCLSPVCVRKSFMTYIHRHVTKC